VCFQGTVWDQTSGSLDSNSVGSCANHWVTGAARLAVITNGK
jgi:hypothetical protein